MLQAANEIVKNARVYRLDYHLPEPVGNSGRRIVSRSTTVLSMIPHGKNIDEHYAFHNQAIQHADEQATKFGTDLIAKVAEEFGVDAAKIDFEITEVSDTSYGTGFDFDPLIEKAAEQRENAKKPEPEKDTIGTPSPVTEKEITI